MAEDSIIILISALAVVTLLLVGLMVSYICIFRHMCCPPAEDERMKKWEHFSNITQDMIQMADISNTTHIDSLTIEMDRPSNVSDHKTL
jgi:hypothetical protein